MNSTMDSTTDSTMNSTTDLTMSSTEDPELEDFLKFLLDMEQFMNNVSAEDYLKSEFVKYITFAKTTPYNILVILTIIHMCICAIGYLGNIITCIVIASDKSMRTTTNVYLFNLAIVDLILLSSGLINYTIPSWYPSQTEKIGAFTLKLGMQGCFFFNWVSDFGVNVAVMTITAFTIERYLAICRPFLARMTLSIYKASMLIFIIWIIGAIFGYLIYSQRETDVLDDDSRICSFLDDTIRYIAEVETLLFFVLPFILMTVMYTLIWKQLVASSKIQKNQGTSSIGTGPLEIKSDDHNNKQILKMLVTVVAVFFFVWAPYHCGRLLLLHLPEILIDILILDYNNIDLYLENIYVIVYFLSSAANPIIYSIMSKKFRCAFKKVFKCWNFCRKKQLMSSPSRSRERSTTQTRV